MALMLAWSIRYACLAAARECMENDRFTRSFIDCGVVGLDFEILSYEQEWRAQQAARSPFCRTVFCRHASRVTCTSRAGTCQDACLRTAYVLPSLGSA